MKISNKKRVENLEKAKPLLATMSVIIYNPATSLPENSLNSIGVRIFIPDNGRMGKYSPSSENAN